MRSALVVVVVAACSSKTEPPPAPAPPAPARDAAPADAPLDLSRPCLPASLAEANVAYVRVDGPRVTACYGNGDDTPGSVTACLVLDELGVVLGPRAWGDASRARLDSRELAPRTVDVEIAEDRTRPGVASVDGTRAFVFDEILDGTRRHWRGRFFDLRTNKQIGDIDLAALDPEAGVFTEPSHVREVRWVGTRVIVTDRVEVGPEYHAYLLSAAGDHVALGDEKRSVTVVDDELVVVTTGKELHLVDVERLEETGTVVAPGRASPLGDLQLTRLGDQLVVAHARPAGVLFVDRATRQTAHARLVPTCP